MVHRNFKVEAFSRVGQSPHAKAISKVTCRHRHTNARIGKITLRERAVHVPSVTTSAVEIGRKFFAANGRLFLRGNMQTSQYWIEHLRLQPHPEGGFFREVYRSSDTIAADGLPARFGGRRSVATSIIYLLQRDQRSVFHRIKSDETWHFYAGAPLELFQLDERCVDEVQRIIIGRHVHAGEQIQWTVPAEVWFGGRPLSQGTEDYSLLGCTVSPGFDFADFEMADRTSLMKLFPKHSELIRSLT